MGWWPGLAFHKGPGSLERNPQRSLKRPWGSVTNGRGQGLGEEGSHFPKLPVALWKSQPRYAAGAAVAS